MLASQWVCQRTKSVSIPAEEQNAGRVVDYFYRMEFHITPRFFSDSNYLFFVEGQAVRKIIITSGRGEGQLFRSHTNSVWVNFKKKKNGIQKEGEKMFRGWYNKIRLQGPKKLPATNHNIIPTDRS